MTLTDRELFQAAERIVKNSVLCCQSATVEKLSTLDPSFFDEIENSSRRICVSCCEAVAPDAEEDDSCENCGEHVGCDFEAQEIYEWWAVDNWLADRLSEHGEPIHEGLDAKLWGRTTTGQAIALDGVIQSIARDLHERHS